MAAGLSSSRAGAPGAGPGCSEGSAQPAACDLPRVSAASWKAALNMPVREQMQISSFSFFWVRFMPPAHAQPPGSNKSQRGRECGKESVTLLLRCEGPGDGTCGDRPATPRHAAPASHTFLLLQQRPPPRPGGTGTDFLSGHPLSLPSCTSGACVPRCQRLGRSRQPHHGSQVFSRR